MIERADRTDEIARVGEVDIVDPGGDAGFGNPVVAPLERACGIDEQKGFVLAEDSGHVAIAVGAQ